MDPRQQHAERVAELFRREYPRLCNYIARRVRKENAPDLIAHAFERLLSIPEPERIRLIRPYLYKLVRTEVFSARRSFATRKRLEHLIQNDNAPLSPEETQMQEEQLRLVTEAIAELPSLQRRALTLVYSRGYTQERAADAMGISRSWFRILTAQGLQAVQRRMDVVPSDNSEGPS